MYLKKGDNVIVMAGKEKGKKGKIMKVLPKENRIVLEGLNMKKRHQRARKTDSKGQMVDIPSSLHASNVMLVDSKSGKASRVGKRLVGEKFVRIARKSGQEI